MKIIEPSIEVLTPISNDILKQIELCARICYKSEGLITESTESAVRMVKTLIKNQHLAMLEHASVSVKVICDRGVSHEIVRHRMASYAQESTRYCCYSQDKFNNELTFIKPCFWHQEDAHYLTWLKIMLYAEKAYLQLIEHGAKPEEARSVLPNSFKTEIIMTMNLREWIHFFNLRYVGTTGKPHPQMKQVAGMILEEFKKYIPVVFDDFALER